MKSLHTLLSVLFVTISLLAQDTQSPPVADAILRLELLKRVEQDQAIRRELIAKGVQQTNRSDEARIRAIDADNTDRMKAIVKRYGWPGPELVGKDGSEAAFLLVQHANHAFQKEMLPLVKHAYVTGALSGQNFALLQDRVLVGDGKLQIYGTQFKIQGKELFLDPIEDELNVDRRRAEVGLPPLVEYLEFARRMYFPENKR
jgi:hypothetical protein